MLTGHRGLAEAVLFTDLDKLGEGDHFYLHIMDEVLAYQVDQVKVVEPERTEDLEIIPGGDYCTLVTCTPYAINTHRMLCAAPACRIMERTRRPPRRRPCSIRSCTPAMLSSVLWTHGRGSA